MDVNYTPLNIASFRKKGEVKQIPSHKSFDINVVFLSLIVITLAILAVLVFIIIEKKVQELGLAGFFA